MKRHTASNGMLRESLLNPVMMLGFTSIEAVYAETKSLTTSRANWRCSAWTWSCDDETTSGVCDPGRTGTPLRHSLSEAEALGVDYNDIRTTLKSCPAVRPWDLT